MVSAFDSGSSGPGSSPGRGTALCSWARHFTLMVPLSTQVYKWVSANLLLGVTLRWTSIPFQVEVEIHLVASCYRNWDKLWPDGPLGSKADFTFTYGNYEVIFLRLHKTFRGLLLSQFFFSPKQKGC